MENKIDTKQMSDMLLRQYVLTMMINYTNKLQEKDGAGAFTTATFEDFVMKIKEDIQDKIAGVLSEVFTEISKREKAKNDSK